MRLCLRARAEHKVLQSCLKTKATLISCPYPSGSLRRTGGLPHFTHPLPARKRKCRKRKKRQVEKSTSQTLHSHLIFILPFSQSEQPSGIYKEDTKTGPNKIHLTGDTGVHVFIFGLGLLHANGSFFPGPVLPLTKAGLSCQVRCCARLP